MNKLAASLVKGVLLASLGAVVSTAYPGNDAFAAENRSKPTLFSCEEYVSKVVAKEEAKARKRNPDYPKYKIDSSSYRKQLEEICAVIGDEQPAIHTVHFNGKVSELPEFLERQYARMYGQNNFDRLGLGIVVGQVANDNLEKKYHGNSIDWNRDRLDVNLAIPNYTYFLQGGYTPVARPLEVIIEGKIKIITSKEFNDLNKAK